jgi:hypothetical protein
MGSLVGLGPTFLQGGASFLGGKVEGPLLAVGRGAEAGLTGLKFAGGRLVTPCGFGILVDSHKLAPPRLA